MLDLGSILPSLLENITRLLPVRLTFVRPYERGVKFSCGKHVTVLEPGVHAFWNYWQDVESVSVALQCVESQKLALTTKDGKTVVLSIAVQYSIADAQAYWTAVQDFDQSLLNMIEGEVSRVVYKKTADEIIADPQRFGDAVNTVASRTAKKWGCEIHNVSLPNLAVAKVIRLVGDALPT